MLSVSFAHDQPHATFDLNETYLLLMNTDGTDSHSAWNGRTVAIQTSVETTIAIADVQVCVCGWVGGCEKNHLTIYTMEPPIKDAPNEGHL